MPSPIRVQRPGEFPRVHVPAAADLADEATLKGLLDELEARPLDSPAALEKWLADMDEVFSCFVEEASRRNIEMTCATDDPEAEKRHLHVVRDLHPLVAPVAERLSRKYLACPHRKALDAALYAVHDRNEEIDVRLFRQENVELGKRESMEKQKYQKAMGAMSVTWNGEERTLEQMAVLQQSADRAEREKAWRLVTDRRLRDRATLDGMFDGLVKLRHEMARNAGFPDFVEYTFPRKHRFDYTPADCVAFHEAAEACAVPFLRRMDARRRARLKLPALRPWDLGVDETGRPPLRPFATPEELTDGCLEIFRGLDPEVGAAFGMMKERGLLDLGSRRGKAPGGYQSTLHEVRLPFIFMNAAGMDRDVFTLLHEGGHAFHSVLSRKQPLLSYRGVPHEFAEVASMGMELLCQDRLAPFYDEEEAARSLRAHLEGTISLLPWVATIDAFQHWIYRNPGHTAEERSVAFRGLVARFGNDIDWSGLEEARDWMWHRQLHVFLYPFYYIEYAIAQMGALQLWVNHRRDPAKALAQYKAGLALGGSRPLPELFATAGLKFDLSRRMLEPLVAEVEEVLAGLPE